MKLGERIRDRRLQLGLKQEDLAKLSGLSQPKISKIESGRTELDLTVVQICDALNIDIQDLIGVMNLDKSI